MRALLSKVANPIIAVSLGVFIYKRHNKPIAENEYFQSGYQFKFMKTEKWALDEEELQAYSEKFRYCGEFVKKNSSRDIKVVKFKDEDGTSVRHGKFLSIGSLGLLPKSSYQNLSDFERKLAESDSESLEACIMHELGHIEHNHCDKTKIGVPLIAISTCLVPTKYAIPVLCILSGIYCFVRRRDEYEADAYAVKKGYGSQLKKYFEQVLESNKTCETYRFITKSGENLLDIFHPFLQSRIQNIERLMKYM